MKIAIMSFILYLNSLFCVINVLYMNSFSIHWYRIPFDFKSFRKALNMPDTPEPRYLFCPCNFARFLAKILLQIELILKCITNFWNLKDYLKIHNKFLSKFQLNHLPLDKSSYTSAFILSLPWKHKVALLLFKKLTIKSLIFIFFLIIENDWFL